MLLVLVSGVTLLIAVLALPLVLVLIAILRGGRTEAGALTLAAVAGLALGGGVARFLGASVRYEPLTGVAVGLLVFTAAYLTSANLFLAGFAAGVTIASVALAIRRSFEPFGERISDIAVVTALSIVAHFSIDVLVARWFRRVGAGSQGLEGSRA